MGSMFSKWQRDQGQGLPLSYRLNRAARYAADLLYARCYLFGRTVDIGKLPRIRKRPVIENNGKLKIGDDFFLNSQFAQSHIVVMPGGDIEIGNQVVINFGAAISSQTKISIGNRCHIGPHVMMMDANYHAIEKDDRASGSGKKAEIILEDEVWLASRVTILPGTRVGRGAVISAGSVVSGVIPPDVVVAGNPAVIVKTLTPAVVHQPVANLAPQSQQVNSDTSDGLLAQVIHIVQQTFFITDKVDSNSGADQILGWDSLGQLRLMANIEDAFGVNIAPEDISRMSSVGAITELLQEYRVGPAATSSHATESAANPVNQNMPQSESWSPAALGGGYALDHPTLLYYQQRARGPVNDNGVPLKVAILRNYTVEPVLDVLKVEMGRMGFKADFYVGDFDTIAADVLNPQSAFHAYGADFIIIAQWLELLAPQFVRAYLTVKESVAEELERIVSHLRLIITSIRSTSNAPILLNNFPALFPPVLGILDSQKSELQIGSLNKLNQMLIEMKNDFDNVFVVDYHASAALMGAELFYSEKLWQIGKIPLTYLAFVEVGLLYARFLRALRGKAKKCLVLDCDNTLWGGIVGDEGAHGVGLGSSFPGSSFVNFQKEILGLHDRGVILALCSKNNEADALEVLRVNEHSVLKEEHFAIWEINWNDKASNIRNIAQRLNIGLDSIVFVDDSSFECELVRSILPEVEVIQVPQHPEKMAGLLLHSGLFDSLSFTEEDRIKNSMYRAEAQRQRIREGSSNLEEYLHSLQLNADIRLADLAAVERVAQLTQKTNQFNLTTKRYSTDDVRGWIAQSERAVFSLKVSDKIADFGLVGVAIVRQEQEHAYIDTFLLSCRVLGRGIETAFLRHIIDYLRQNQAGVRVHGYYTPSAKNGQVADFYAKHGFAEVAEHHWVLKPEAQPCALPSWITVTRGIN